jgi:hypothetical protein
MAPIVARRFEEVFDLSFGAEETAWPSPLPSIVTASAN